MEKDIIEIYFDIKNNNKKFPNGTWIGVEGKENLIRLFKYLTTENKIELKRLTIKFFKENHMYIPLQKYFDGKVFKLIEEVYPGVLQVFEMDNVPKHYWSKKENIEKAFEYYIKEMNVEEIMKLKKRWFYENRLSTPLSKKYRNMPRLFIDDIYIGLKK